MDDKSVMQRVYEHVVRAGRPVRTREIVAAVGALSVSSVTFALTRLVREGNLRRTGYAAYALPAEDAPNDPPACVLEPLRLDARLTHIFETIRPSLSFEDLSFLYNVVLTAMRLAPDLFREVSVTKSL